MVESTKLKAVYLWVVAFKDGWSDGFLDLDLCRQNKEVKLAIWIGSF